jgi:hypothetical protein
VLLLGASQARAATAATFGEYALTSLVRATSTAGNIGLSGGLTPLDSGSASIDASLDANPSAMVLARPVEPGTTFATLNSQLPTPVAVPEADAAYPGTTPSASTAPTPASTASAKVTQTTAVGAASTAGVSTTVATLGATTASTSLAATGSGHAVTASADAYVAGLDVAGVLDVQSVAGHAAVTSTAGGARTAVATLTVGSITVAGQAVAVDDTGLHAVGATLPLGPTLAQLTTAANATLAKAGISLSLAQPIHTTGVNSLGGMAAADSGGLSITVNTPVIGSDTIPANTFTFTLGRVQVTESDTPAFATAPVTVAQPGAVVPATPPIPGTPAVPASPGRVVTVSGGTAPTSGTSANSGAAPAAGAQTELVLAGRQVTPRTAIAALGGWEALTLGAATFAVVGLRGAGDDEEEHLCPCPT